MEQVAYLQLLIFTLYIFFVWNKYGILKSISESYYTIDDEWLFILLCTSLGILHLLYNNIYFFIGGSALCFVGATARFKSWSVTKRLHNISAVTAIVSSIMGLYFLGTWFTIIPVILVATALLIIKSKEIIWWVEIASFYSIIVSLIISL